MCLSGSRNQTEIGADPLHQEILLAQMNLDGASVKSVATPAVKVQECRPQMLTKLDKGRASTFRSATMRASYMSINRVDVQQAVIEVARFMAEPNEGAWRYVKAPRVDTDSDHLFHAVNLIKAGSWAQGTRNLSVAESAQESKGGRFCWGAKIMMIDLRRRCWALCSWYGQQFSQEYHGETWSRTESISALSSDVVARTWEIWRDSHRETKGRAQHDKHWKRRRWNGAMVAIRWH